jgi:hypothetical protein
VLGIGTVELDVRAYESPPADGTSIHHRLVLKDVLHAPGIICNIVGYPLLDPPYNYDVNFGQCNTGITDRKTGKSLGLFNEGALYHLRLRGHAAGHSSLNKKGTYLLDATWSSEERRRWEEYKQGNRSKQAGQGSEPPYTGEGEEEKKKKKNKKKRSRAKRKNKGAKAGDKKDGEAPSAPIAQAGDSEEDEESDIDGDSFLAELEADPMSHLADYNFTDKELKWIKKHYDYSSKFMLSFGLKPFVQEDCDEAKAIIKAFMSND